MGETEQLFPNKQRFPQATLRKVFMNDNLYIRVADLGHLFFSILAVFRFGIVTFEIQTQTET
jgi:hypothetical protein